MGYRYLRPRWVLVDSWHRSGTKLWRAEIEVDGRLMDASAWADSPAQASSDGRALAAKWAQLRRWEAAS